MQYYKCNRCGRNCRASCVPCRRCSAYCPVYLFAANERSGLDVAASGSNVPLPDAKISSDGVLADASSSMFTILVPGVYRLVYHVNLEVPENVSTRLTLNGKQVDASVLNPVAPESKFSAEVFLQLKQGDVISLQMFNADTSIVFQLGVGATLSIKKEN